MTGSHQTQATDCYPGDGPKKWAGGRPASLHCLRASAFTPGEGALEGGLLTCGLSYLLWLWQSPRSRRALRAGLRPAAPWVLCSSHWRTPQALNKFPLNQIGFVANGKAYWGLDLGEISEFLYPKALLESGFTNNWQCNQTKAPSILSDKATLSWALSTYLHCARCSAGITHGFLHSTPTTKARSPPPVLLFTEIATCVNLRLSFPSVK